MRYRTIPKRRARLALASLLFATAICVSMLILRGVGFGQWRFSFLPGNLLLAWIPLIFAAVVYFLRVRESRQHWLLAGCAVIWFLFYPNAPYLITDLVHLKTRGPVPRWFDLILMMSFAWTGLFLGNLSLYLMQEVVRAWRGRAWSWTFAAGMLALGAVGVYLGRFWRWNSWEAITRPLGLASDAWHRLHGMSGREAALFSVTFFAFSGITYLIVYTVAHLHGHADPTELPSDEGGGEKPVAAGNGLR